MAAFTGASISWVIRAKAAIKVEPLHDRREAASRPSPLCAARAMA
jgi:hypothetical protein